MTSFPLALDSLDVSDMESFRQYHETMLLAEAWTAKRKDVLSLWNNLSPNQPINMMPIPQGHRGTRFDDDGIRITGSPLFIASILSRIKDILRYDQQPNLRLDIEYRQVNPKNQEVGGVAKYACYIHLQRKT